MKGPRTVVINEICYADAEECRFEARVEACYAFSLHYSTDRIVRGGVGPFGLDLGPGGEGYERVAGHNWSVIDGYVPYWRVDRRQCHGKKSSTGPAQSM